MIWGIVFVLIGGFVGFIYHTKKSVKDPDVQTASNLKMSLTSFRKYQKLYDDYQEFMATHGVNSSDSEKYYLKNIFPQIKNQNEWRRYQNFREQKAQEERLNEILNIQ